MTSRWATLFAATTLMSVHILTLTPIIKGIYNYMAHQKSYEQKFPLFATYFYECPINWVLYIFPYIMEVTVGSQVAALFVGADIILCAMVVQCIMHFNYIRRSLEA